MVQPRRVLVVDDHAVVRRGLRAMLESEDWVAEVVEASTVAGAVKEAVHRRVDVVAMDVLLPDGSGIDATRQIVRSCPQARVLILSFSAEPDTVDQAFQAGATGYFLKDTEPEDAIIDALRMVADGGVVVGPRVSSTLTADRTPARLRPPFDQLTAREIEILALLAGGASNLAIANRLRLSEKTVRNQMSTIYGKLGCNDRLQVALTAREAGIVGSG